MDETGYIPKSLEAQERFLWWDFDQAIVFLLVLGTGVIAGGFVAIGILAPGSPIEGGFEAHLGGISLGLGLGWLIKSFIDLHGSRHAQQS